MVTYIHLQTVNLSCGLDVMYCAEDYSKPSQFALLCISTFGIPLLQNVVNTCSLLCIRMILGETEILRLAYLIQGPNFLQVVYSI